MMTPFRQRMTEDMQVRNLALNTQTSYVQQVSLFARHFNKSPELFQSIFSSPSRRFGLPESPRCVPPRRRAKMLCTIPGPE
jgi:hypothetical protein